MANWGVNLQLASLLCINWLYGPCICALSSVMGFDLLLIETVVGLSALWNS